MVYCRLCKEEVMAKDYKHHWLTLCRPHHDKLQKLCQTLAKLIRPERDSKILDDILRALEPILPCVEAKVNLEQHFIDVSVESIVSDIDSFATTMPHHHDTRALYHLLLESIRRFRDDEDSD